MNALTQAKDATRYDDVDAMAVRDILTVEAVLQLRVNKIAYTTTVRTPGDDEVLARGLLFTEGVVTNPNVALAYRVVADPETGITARLDIDVDPGYIEKELEDRRSAMGSSSCGMCGIREPEELKLTGNVLRVEPKNRFDIQQLSTLFDTMRKHQTAFEESGGCHAAAAFSVDGGLLRCHEDIGRHNAVDKVIGGVIQDRTLESANVLLVSGRMSYEIVFKAYQARIPHLFAVSAPSTLAVEMGQRFGMTIGGFCRDDRATIYAGEKNLVSS